MGMSYYSDLIDREKKMENPRHILTENLTASFQGDALPEKYRAVLIRRTDGDVISIEQPINGGWHSTGGYWFVDDLWQDLEPYSEDHIWIDWGQRWAVENGLKNAVHKAVTIITKEDRSKSA